MSGKWFKFSIIRLNDKVHYSNNNYFQIHKFQWFLHAVGVLNIAKSSKYCSLYSNKIIGLLLQYIDLIYILSSKQIIAIKCTDYITVDDI
jgi:hypothetical protein